MVCEKTANPKMEFMIKTMIDDNVFRSKFIELREQVTEILASISGCHGFDHTERVLNNARLIAKMENAPDIQIIECAALLHDIGRSEEIASKGKHCHAAFGAKIAAAMLEKMRFPEPFAIQVAECVRKHRYRRGVQPETLAEKIIYDADKLDSIGAVGIGRAFYFAGREGAVLHNSAAEAMAAPEYSHGDSAYREYLMKLRHIEGKLLTEAARKLAAQRAGFMHDFFEQLNRETDLK